MHGREALVYKEYAPGRPEDWFVVPKIRSARERAKHAAVRVMRVIHETPAAAAAATPYLPALLTTWYACLLPEVMIVSVIPIVM